MRGLLFLVFALALASAQVLPPGGGSYAYSDGTLQVLHPMGEGFRLRYLKGERLFREDRLRLAPEGVYLLGVGFPEGYFPFDPPSSFTPPGWSWGPPGGEAPASAPSGWPFPPGWRAWKGYG